MHAPLPHMADRPLVSVITVVFNGQDGIRRTMDSVLSQSYEMVEYLVIDGGSTDSTVQILQEYSARLAFWRSEPDRGISDAFNKGLERARGEIIGLINAGDWYEVDTVRKVVDAFSRNEGAAVVCGSLQFWKGRSREYRCASVPALLDSDMTVTHPTCFVRAEVYRRVGGYSLEYRLAMDYELLLRIKNAGYPFVALDDVLANMQHDGVSEEHWREALQETHRARRTLLADSMYSSAIYYSLLRAKRRIRILLERLALRGLIRLYRQRLALVRKVK